MKVQGKIEVAVLYIMQTIVEECMYCYKTFSDDSDDHILVLTWKKRVHKFILSLSCSGIFWLRLKYASTWNIG